MRGAGSQPLRKVKVLQDKPSKAQKRNARRQAERKADAQMSADEAAVDGDAAEDVGAVLLAKNVTLMARLDEMRQVCEKHASSAERMEKESARLQEKLQMATTQISELQGKAASNVAGREELGTAVKPGRRVSSELWEQAQAAAGVELAAEFEYGGLCHGGKLLYLREEQTKARRIYARLKERQRVQQNKLALSGVHWHLHSSSKIIQQGKHTGVVHCNGEAAMQRRSLGMWVTRQEQRLRLKSLQREMPGILLRGESSSEVSLQ